MAAHLCISPYQTQQWNIWLIHALYAGTISGVIGVAVTGVILDRLGGASNLFGWFYAHAVCASICMIAMMIFNIFARGDRIFDTSM
jgi:hypothetical protein